MNFLASLGVDIVASWARLLLALSASIALSIFVGIEAATNKRAEGIILPVVDILQTVPILAFFPAVIAFVVFLVPNYIGINIAIVFLIITSMVWNITLGVYEAVKSIPQSIDEVAAISRLSYWQRVRNVYLPASMPRVAYQSLISWSVGLFYLVASEIFSTGSKSFAAQYGIGVEIAKLAVSGSGFQYLIALAFLIVAILLTRYVLLSPLSVYSEKFSFAEEQRSNKSRMLLFYWRVARALKELAPKPKEEKAAKKLQKIYAAIEKKETLPAQRHSLVASVLFPVALFLLFAIVVGYTNSYAYLNEIGSALFFSFVRVGGMYLLCVAVAVPLGIKIAKSTNAFEPVLAALQTVAAIPATVLLPALIVILVALPFGNELVAMSVIFLAMFWYLLFSIISGMRTLPEELRQVAATFRFSWVKKWRNVYLPAILPAFVTGSLTAVGGAWNALIVAEYFSVQRCVGSVCSQVVLSQVGQGIGKLLDVATLVQGNITLLAITLLAMVIMIVLINVYLWQRLYKFVTAKYRVE